MPAIGVANRAFFRHLVSMKTARKKGSHSPARPRSILGQLARMPDKLFTGKFRQQYAALCFRFDENDQLNVLVITSRDSGRWVIPKGWPMKKKSPHEAAAIEAREEAGVRGIVRKKPIGRYTYLKWLDDGDVAPCVVDVFQLEATQISQDFKERGQRSIAWVTPDEAARRVREIELKSLLADFKPRGLKDKIRSRVATE